MRMNMLALVAVLLASSAVCHAIPVGHRKSRVKRNHSNDPDLAVDVQGTNVELKEGESATFRCRAKGASAIERQPYVSFYRELGQYTHMPLSSGDPGIEVHLSVPSVEDYHNFFAFEEPDVIQVVKVLDLGPGIFETLTDGPNKFYCKVSTLNGDTLTSPFEVIKIPVKYPRRRHPFFRRYRG